jgi:hypothetical protein
MTAWAYVADIAAAVGGVASLIGIIIATRALTDTHAARLGQQRDRYRQRLELIAQHLDRMRNVAIADKRRHPERNDWRDHVGLLHRYLAATSLSLPKCREVASHESAGDVLPAMVAADAEITAALGQLSEEGGADRQRRGRGSMESGSRAPADSMRRCLCS